MALFEARRLRAEDGTELTYYAGGAASGPVLVLCGGLGGGVSVWRPFFERFADRYRLLSWDYRGLYRSGPAGHRRAYSLPHHAADLRQLLQHERVESPVLVGWSMGVQVALELHREDPDVAQALVALHGVAGRPLDSAFDSPWSARVAPSVLGLLRAVGTRFGMIGPSLTRTAAVVDAFVWTGRRLGVMASELDVVAFRDVMEEWTRLHLGVYADIFEHLGEHDASDLLEVVRAPTLVIAGSADRFTPPRFAEQMTSALRDARLEVLEGVTHFGLLEQPEAILALVEEFLAERLVASRSAV